MKILVAHNYYQCRGGEDTVYEAEVRLLRGSGHQVVEYTRHNDEIARYSQLEKIALGARSSWSGRTSAELRRLLAVERPDVAHFHNTFPLISPSAYFACAQAGVPVVQTLHNYRLLCPSATFLREGKVCEECLGRTVAWPAMLHGCYRSSRTATAGVASISASHRLTKTWQHKVHAYIALTSFARQKFIAGGLPAERLLVKPNFVERDPGPGTAAGGFALYVGRLAEEKGLRTLLAGWQCLPCAIPLRIVGDGPLKEEIANHLQSSTNRSVDLLGYKSQTEIFSLMHQARFLIVPSVCFENFPLAIAEAFACGLPVIASNLGALAELVSHGQTGLHFHPGDAQDLASKVAWAWTHPREIQSLACAARAEYEAKYTASSALRHLEAAYQFALQHSPPRAATCVALPRKSYSVLGVSVDAVQIPDVVSRMEEWIAQRASGRFIAVTDMHSLMQAQHSSAFKEILRAADLVVPDGFPLVWLGRRKGFVLPRRVYGPELLARFCQTTAAKGYRHFFYGGAPGVAADLGARLASRFPGLQLAGSFCPPFRLLTSQEDTEIVNLINAAHPDVVWVGLGAPKQERWMFDHRRLLNAPVLVGVGAAFDFHTGRVAQAPPWMRNSGLEWLFRLSREPRRLWRRYLIYGTQFVALVLLEALGLRKFPH